MPNHCAALITGGFFFFLSAAPAADRDTARLERFAPVLTSSSSPKSRPLGKNTTRIQPWRVFPFLKFTKANLAFQLVHQTG